jgi:hypothetical protein
MLYTEKDIRKKNPLDACLIKSTLVEVNVNRSCSNIRNVHCKKRFAIFPTPAGISLTKLSLAGNNLIIPNQGRVCSVTSRMGKGKSLTFFYSEKVS